MILKFESHRIDVKVLYETLGFDYFNTTVVSVGFVFHMLGHVLTIMSVVWIIEYPD